MSDELSSGDSALVSGAGGTAGAIVAGMALAVLSERFGAYVTGTTIAVDGGIALKNWIEPRG